jgi:hypothetical protein
LPRALSLSRIATHHNDKGFDKGGKLLLLVLLEKGENLQAGETRDECVRARVERAGRSGASAAAHQRNDGGTEKDLHEHVLKLLNDEGEDGLA